MTREEYLNKQQELLASVRNDTQEYNTAYGEKRYEDAIVINARIEKNVGEYNANSQMLCFEDCLAAEDPMKAAILTLHFPVIGVKDTLIGEDVKIPKRVVVGDPDAEEPQEKYKAIDLLKLHKYSKDHYSKGIGNEANWNNMAESLNLLFALNCAVDIGKAQPFLDEMKSCYALRDASRKINLGAKDPKAGTPISNTGLLKATKAVVSAMIGPDYAKLVMTHDVRFVKKCTAKKSKKELTVQCANHSTMRAVLMEVCYRVLTNGEYNADYKRIKTKAQDAAPAPAPAQEVVQEAVQESAQA